MAENNKNNPLISVIIPVYKVEAYLHQCVDSVLNQTYTDYEIILIDDGSPDNCSQICDDYAKKDSRVKVIHKENGGLSDARNVGIRNANGDYLIFLDSDDYLFSNICLEQLINEILKTNFTLYFLNRIVTDKNKTYQHIDNVIESRNFFIKKIMSNKHSVLAVSFICKRKFIFENDLFFRKSILHEDEEWMPRVLLTLRTTEKVYVINQSFYFYRTNREGAITYSIQEKNLTSKFFIIDEFFEMSKKTSSLEKKFLLTRVAQIITGIIIQTKKIELSNELLLDIKKRERYLLKSSRVKHWILFFIRKLGVI